MEWMSGLLESFEFTWWQAGLILVAGVWAGLINTIVGSGTIANEDTGKGAAPKSAPSPASGHGPAGKSNGAEGAPQLASVGASSGEDQH